MEDVITKQENTGTHRRPTKVNIFLKVGSREEGEEGSAWPLCSGLPLSAADAAQVENREFTYGTHGGIAVRGAPKRAIHALLPPFFSLIPTKRRCREDRGQRRIIIWDARRNCRARRAQARQPRTFPPFFSLLSTLHCSLIPLPCPPQPQAAGGHFLCSPLISWIPVNA